MTYQALDKACVEFNRLFNVYVSVDQRKALRQNIVCRVLFGPAPMSSSVFDFLDFLESNNHNYELASQKVLGRITKLLAG